ncbi:MAG: starch-binding protein [Ruminococcus sp.]|nr:starch-binding protein [Ruminococcus sp.]
MRSTGKQTKRAVSLLLCLALLVTMLTFALTVRAEEADKLADTGADVISYDGSNNNDDRPPIKELADTGAAGGYVYCKNTAGWSAVYAYMWNSDSDKNANWPGEKMTNVGDNIWRYQYSKSYAKIIFNIGSNQTQTKDMDFPGSGYIYDNSTENWSVHENTPTVAEPTQGNNTPTTPQPTQGGGTSGKTYVYCENEAGWAKVTAYMWGGSPKVENGGWPGVEMTNIGGNTWRYEVTNSKFTSIIFSNNGASQTADLTFPGKDYSWNNKTNEWSIHDTSPLQISSFVTDLASPQYAGTGITLSAEAEGQGTVYYKFSVSNGSSTTVLSDFSTANKAQWIPQSTGTYTITYDFKDTAGNTNQRTKSYIIDDGSTVVAPFIKTVTPNGGDIQNGSNVNINVTAGGGNTGTNLLFYKYTVKNPSGNIVNVPYYTRNTSYTFRPTELGLHTLTINVQGSDNKTIDRSYIFSSVGTVVPTDPPATEPPVKPTDAPPAPTQPKPTDAPPAPTEPVGEVLYGDADDDGDVTVLDATFIQRSEANVYLPTPLNERNADVDGDDDVSIIDATLIQRFVAGIIKVFPAES